MQVEGSQERERNTAKPLRRITRQNLEHTERSAEIARVETDRLSIHSGWEIRRTSLKVRNPNNMPDPWEEEVLKLFAQRLAEGVNPETFEFAKVVNLDGKRVFRYMKPIVMQDFCTTCHGQGLSPDLAEKIAEKYPEDQAVGFNPGDFRGAFSMLKVLPGDPP